MRVARVEVTVVVGEGERKIKRCFGIFAVTPGQSSTTVTGESARSTRGALAVYGRGETQKGE